MYGEYGACSLFRHLKMSESSMLNTMLCSGIGRLKLHQISRGSKKEPNVSESWGISIILCAPTRRWLCWAEDESTRSPNISRIPIFEIQRFFFLFVILYVCSVVTCSFWLVVWLIGPTIDLSYDCLVLCLTVPMIGSTCDWLVLIWLIGPMIDWSYDWLVP